MRYQDFEIRIEADTESSLKAKAVSPFGPGESEFKLPFPKDELSRVVEEFEILLDPSSKEPARYTPEQIGEALYAALFSEGVGQRFHETLASLRASGSTDGLRIRLNLNLRNPELVPIATLPWELLRDKERDDFLGRLRQTSIVRFLPVSRPPLPPFIGPLKILIVASGPSGLAQLKLKDEWERIWSTLEDRPEILVDRIDQPSLSDLWDKLDEDTWHVIHFIGHGGFDDENGIGAVCFVAPDGKKETVPGALFGEHLKSFPSVRLVFLNACDTARLPRANGQDAYQSTAAALVLAGVPAVIAMQTPIFDKSAIELSARFYGSLAKHRPVDAALADGRLAILRTGSLEWATPTLFTRIADANILGEESRNGDARRSSSQSSVRRSNPLRLGIRTFTGTEGFIVWGKEMDEECDEILDLRPFFTGKGNRHPKDPACWHGEVVPRLQDFLRRASTSLRPLHLNFAAHASIAFTAGHLLNVKSGLDITLRQRVKDGSIQEWPVAPTAPVQEKLFRELRDVSGDPKSQDMAMALSITRPVLVDVQEFLKTTQVPVRRTMPVELAAGPAWNGVRDGLHALRLAEVIATKIASRTIQERYGVVHLFAAAPNALLFFLGQLSNGLGRIQLYEHDFESGLPGAYSPSILLPVKE
jgi:hypothetical protein